MQFSANANITCSQFHQHFSRTFFVHKTFLCLEFGFERTFVQKMRAKNIDEIDTWAQSYKTFRHLFRRLAQ